jgi:hypothetical protein
MDKRINKQIENYMISFKDNLRKKICDLDFENKTKANDLCEYIYEYERLVVSKDDLTKRKRVQNDVPASNRCIAKRANNEQCTRRKKEGCDYCGTHAKGTPNGSFQTIQNASRKLEVVAQVINGIVYYIDQFNNVYDTSDILNNIENPRIIASFIKENNQIEWSSKSIL